jgi:hypothetical protein
MFNEEWELMTEPLLLNALPVISLSGIATKEDEYKSKRAEFWSEYESTFDGRDASNDKIDDLMQEIKHPKIEEPDLHDPTVFGPLFESANRNLNLYHSKDTMDGFFELYDDIELLRSRQELETPKWDCRVETLEQYITGIANKYTR